MPKKSKEEIDKMSNEELESYLNDQREFYQNTINFVRKIIREVGSYEMPTNKIEGVRGFDMIHSSGNFPVLDEYVIVGKNDLTLLRIQVEEENAKTEVYRDGPWEDEFKELLEKGNKLIEEIKKEKKKEIDRKRERNELIKELDEMGLY